MFKHPQGKRNLSTGKRLLAGVQLVGLPILILGTIAYECGKVIGEILLEILPSIRLLTHRVRGWQA